MRRLKNERGFTLIELLLVIGVVAVLLAVIIPMGLKTSISSKYGVVRQNCTELGSYAHQWVEKSILAQDEQRSTATIKDYFASLSGAASAADEIPGLWIAFQGANNWNLGVDGTVENRQTRAITGRWMDGNENAAPEDCVEDIIPPDKAIRNPFNEVNIFRPPNLPGEGDQGQAITGAIAIGGAREEGGDSNWVYYAFAFQGTDSTTSTLTGTDTTFHAGMGIDTIPKLRNGVFVGRFR